MKSWIVPFALKTAFSVSLWGNIYEIQTLDSVKSEIEKSDERTLVVFDMDEVCLTAIDKVLQLPSTREQVRKKIAEKHGNARLNELYALIWKDYKSRLIDEAILDVIQLLQEKQIKFLGLTASGTGPLGTVISDMVEFRLNQFKALGLNFDNSFPELDTFSFNDNFDDKHPVFKNGTAFTDGVSKPSILETILKNNGFLTFFTKIVVLEDSLKNLEALQTWATNRGIEFVGFHYTAVEEWHKQHPLHEQCADIQMEHLGEKGQWISDEEAYALLTQREGE